MDRPLGGHKGREQLLDFIASGNDSRPQDMLTIAGGGIRQEERIYSIVALRVVTGLSFKG